MGRLKLHDLMAEVQDSNSKKKTKKQTRRLLPKLLRLDMGSNVSENHDFLGTVDTNVYWECVCVCVCVCVGGGGGGRVGGTGGYGEPSA